MQVPAQSLGPHGAIYDSYLLEEWKERNKESPEDISTKFKNLRFLPLEVFSGC